MTSKKFYTYVISKWTPLLFVLLFLPGWVYMQLFKEIYIYMIAHYTWICIALIFIIEIFATFIKTLFILQKRKITDKARIRLYLFLIPYLPPIIGCLLYSLYLLHFKNLDPNSSRRFIVYIYAITSTLNYGFSMFLNTKLNIFRFISDDIEKDSNEEKV